MHRVVWKYVKFEGARLELELPRRSIIRKIAEQHGKLCFWVEFAKNPTLAETDTELRHFRMYATGQAFPYSEKLEYVDTVLMAGGNLVWHIYEVTDA